MEIVGNSLGQGTGNRRCTRGAAVRFRSSVLSGQAFLYLHYADMIANGYKRTMPCPFRSQGLLLNPYGDLYYCENSNAIGNNGGSIPSATAASE